MSSEESLKKLYEAYWSTQRVCRPDEYQMRMNNLTISLAEYILADRLKSLQEDKEDGDG